MDQVIAELKPLTRPVAAFPQYIAQAQPVTLLLEKTSLVTNTFGVTFAGSLVQAAVESGAQTKYQSGKLSSNNDIIDSDANPPPSYSSQVPEQEAGSQVPSLGSTGHALFHIDPHLGFPAYQSISDAATKDGICNIRREVFSFKTGWYVEASDGERRILEMEARLALDGKHVFHLLNNQAGDGETVTFLVKKSTLKLRHEVYLGYDERYGQLVGLIEREHMHIHSHHNLIVSQGLDILIVVAISMILVDMLRV